MEDLFSPLHIVLIAILVLLLFGGEINEKMNKH